jgi:DNA-binding SARP family transcriptional activator/tetratricopeptide (TPR) repeat protein
MHGGARNRESGRPSPGSLGGNRGTPRYKLLGPVQAFRDGELVAIRSSTQISVLARLLISAGEFTAVGELAEFVWGGGGVEHPKAVVHTAVSRLRRLLGSEAIETAQGGYRLAVSADDVDVLRFGRLVGEAERAEQAGSPESAAGFLAEAMALWDWPLLANVDAAGSDYAADRLAERHLNVAETWADLCLRMARYVPVIEKLQDLSQSYPFRERMVGQLVMALFSSGRQADALSRYESLRRSLADELGVEPSPELQELHLSMLRGRLPVRSLPASFAGATVAVPRQLPAEPSDFTGRHDEAVAITSALSSGRVRVVLIAGPGGVGKTTLAVRCAGQVSDMFPGGQLYADFGTGVQQDRAEPAAILVSFLRALGVAGQAVPDAPEERLALYRTLLAERRVLVVLDNAVDESQVRPLLPGGAASAVLVVSRTRMAGIPAILEVDLKAFDEASGLEFLSRAAGKERISSEPEAARRIVSQCGGLPLALRIAGARLAARPQWRIATLVNRLSSTRYQLDEFSYGDLDLRASITFSYEGLSELQRTMLHSLSHVDMQKSAAWVGAALLDIGLEEANEVLEELAESRLLDVTLPQEPGGPRYFMHDLVRAYARERASVHETPAQIHAALGRALGGLLALAQLAHRKIHGGDYTIIHGAAERWYLSEVQADEILAGDPLRWLDSEQAAIRDAIRQSADLGMAELSWDLAWTAVTLFEARGYSDDWEASLSTARAAAEATGNVRGIAAMLQAEAGRLHYYGNYADARSAAGRAAALFAEVGDRRGQALALCRLAHLDSRFGRPEDALEKYGRVHEELSGLDRYMEALTLRGMAQVHVLLGNHDNALECLMGARHVFAAIGSGRGETQVLHVLGDLRLRQRDYSAAEETYRQFLSLARDLGEKYAEMLALKGLGAALSGLGQPALASDALTHALSIAQQFGDKQLVSQLRRQLDYLHSGSVRC